MRDKIIELQEYVDTYFEESEKIEIRTRQPDISTQEILKRIDKNLNSFKLDSKNETYLEEITADLENIKYWFEFNDEHNRCISETLTEMESVLNWEEYDKL